jgi:hypothetical protein
VGPVVLKALTAESSTADERFLIERRAQFPTPIIPLLKSKGVAA